MNANNNTSNNNHNKTNILFELIKEEKIKEITDFILYPDNSVWNIKESTNGLNGNNNNDNINDIYYTLVLHKACFLNLPKATIAILINTKKRLINDIETFKSFVNGKTTDNKTPLHYASFRGNIEIIKLLISNYADASAKTTSGLNMMHFACQGNQTSSLVYFKMKARLNVHLGDMNDNTPLHIAVINGSEQALIYLLQWNANPNIQNKEGQTPLHSAVINHKVRLIKKLLQKGADKGIKDYANKTPVQYAIDLNHQDTVAIFKDSNLFEVLFYKPPILKHKYNGVNAAFFLCLHLFISICTYIIILPLYNSYPCTALYIILLIIELSSFAMLHYSNPGILINKSNKGGLLALVEDGHNVNDYCPNCLIRKIRTTKHCVICNKCIDMFDHHCVWVNNCIGIKNFKLFIVFLIFTLLNTLLNIVISLISIFRKDDLSLELETEKNRIPLMLQGAEVLYYPSTRISVSILLTVICVIFIFPIISLLYSRINTLLSIRKLKNMTELYSKAQFDFYHHEGRKELLIQK